ncbi:Fur family transcriptional regulator [Mycolicibacterium palauense]|uniref:Fur family transcriptional regulator n=1 Tax=Mycolicibacterium palauense TaxID=2034511 RepID=UPI000BFED777|nr:Fur family transcriptional regulator [Mycolicibacterium palauense]
MSAQHPDPELVRKHLLNVLSEAGGDLTTAELRQLLARWAPGLVNETVYRNLLVLEHRGEVRRLRRPGRRHVAWALVTPAHVPAKEAHR